MGKRRCWPGQAYMAEPPSLMNAQGRAPRAATKLKFTGDSGGPPDTCMDPDLRRYTHGDGLPVVCKQGVRGSSPLSCTGQKHNSKSRAHILGQVQQQSTATGTA